MKTELITERLCLSMPVIEDLENLYQLSSRPEVNLFNPHGPDQSIDQTKETLEYWINADWKGGGVGYYMVRERGSHAYIGYVGVAMRKFYGMNMLNLAYRIHPEFQGKGFVVEACRDVIAEAKKTFPNRVIRVLTKNNNAPSIGVAKKLGFIHNAKFDNDPEEGDVSLFDMDVDVSNSWK